jgi:hypothetical protein
MILAEVIFRLCSLSSMVFGFLFFSGGELDKAIFAILVAILMHRVACDG